MENKGIIVIIICKLQPGQPADLTTSRELLYNSTWRSSQQTVYTAVCL